MTEETGRVHFVQAEEFYEYQKDADLAQAFEFAALSMVHMADVQQVHEAVCLVYWHDIH